MSFDEFDTALRMKALVASIVNEQIEALRPADRFGVVKSVNAAAQTALVILDGDTDPVLVKFSPDITPSSTIDSPDLSDGYANPNRVRVVGVAGNLWITQILNGVPVGQIPPGTTMPYFGSGSTAPTGFVFADGSELPIATYKRLYNALTTNGTVFPYGANTNGSGGAGSTHFRLPNGAGRTFVGLDSGQVEFDTIGETGGAKTHILAISEMPSHDHSPGAVSASAAHSHTNILYSNTAFDSTSGSRPVGGDGTAVPATPTVNGATESANATHTHTITAQGGGGAHNNLQPYIVGRYIVKL